MSSERARLLLMLACILSVLGGCAGVPPAPPHTQNGAASGGDEYDGWLFKSLTGRGNKESSAAQQVPPQGAATTPTASAWPAQPGAAGPLIPGPASPSASGMAGPPTTGSPVIFAPGETVAGPPPSIPAELPSAPGGAVSIGDIKGKEEEKKKGFELSDLAPENIYKGLKAAAGYGPNEQVARAAMQEGKALYRDKKYKEAAAKFAVAADRWPDSPLEEDALFLQGDSEFFSDQYRKAHDTYGGLLKKYSNSRYLDTVAAREFSIGRYWEQKYDAKPTWPTTPNLTDDSLPRFGTFSYAIQAYERVRQYDPTGPLADASVMALGNAYFRQGQFEDAAQHYDTLRKEYPNSKYQMNAHLLDLQAKMRVYQGTLYDETALKDAGKIADQTLAQFSDKLGTERARVAQARAQILEEKANRDFVRAEYYEQHKYYGAARFYYKGVIDEYPSTERAKEARTRMEKIRTEPDEPPNHFAWLTGIFETKKR
jgi:TolA-binding protein